MLDHLAGGAVDVHRLAGRGGGAIDLATGFDGQDEHQQREACRPLGLPRFLRHFFVDHLNNSIARRIDQAEGLRDGFFLPRHKQERLSVPFVLRVLKDQLEEIACRICVWL